jgi:hypothetical protein
VALNPKYGFEKYLVFEPSLDALDYLRNYIDEKITLFPFGLGKEDVDTWLYNSGTVGASIFADKFKGGSGVSKELISIRKASVILKPYLEKNKVYMRINCEGSEIDIIEELLSASLLRSSHSFLVDFDILKINPMYPIENLFSRLEKNGIKIIRKPFGGGSTKTQVKKWLDFEILEFNNDVKLLDLLKYYLKLYLPFRVRFIKYFSFLPVKIRIRMFIILRAIKIVK